MEGYNSFQESQFGWSKNIKSAWSKDKHSGKWSKKDDGDTTTDGDGSNKKNVKKPVIAGRGGINWKGQKNKIKKSVLEDNSDPRYNELSSNLTAKEESKKVAPKKEKKKIQEDINDLYQEIDDHLNSKYPAYKDLSDKIDGKAKFQAENVKRSKSLRLKLNDEQAHVLRNMLINAALLHDKVLGFMNSEFRLNDPEILADITDDQFNKIEAQCKDKFIKTPSDIDKPDYVGVCINKSRVAVGLPQVAAFGVVEELIQAHKAYRTNVKKRNVAKETTPELKGYKYDRKFRNGKEYAKQRKGTIKVEWISTNDKCGKLPPSINIFSSHYFGGFKHHVRGNFELKAPNSCLKKVPLLVSNRRMNKMDHKSSWTNSSGETVYHYTHIPPNSLPRIMYLDFNGIGWSWRFTHDVPKGSKGAPTGAEEGDGSSINSNSMDVESEAPIIFKREKVANMDLGEKFQSYVYSPSGQLYCFGTNTRLVNNTRIVQHRRTKKIAYYSKAIKLRLRELAEHKDNGSGKEEVDRLSDREKKSMAQMKAKREFKNVYAKYKEAEDAFLKEEKKRMKMMRQRLKLRREEMMIIIQRGIILKRKKASLRLEKRLQIIRETREEVKKWRRRKGILKLVKRRRRKQRSKKLIRLDG